MVFYFIAIYTFYLFKNGRRFFIFTLSYFTFLPLSNAHQNLISFLSFTSGLFQYFNLSLWPHWFHLIPFLLIFTHFYLSQSDVLILRQHCPELALHQLVLLAQLYKSVQRL